MLLCIFKNPEYVEKIINYHINYILRKRRGYWKYIFDEIMGRFSSSNSL